MNEAAESQDEVLAFLADPHSYGAADSKTVRRIDTHAATVFLAGERVLKIKRAVRFPFLDFSTLDKRKAACESELAVNQPFAPEIYDRVVAITRQRDRTLAIAGNGAPVEWAVQMHRFDETRTLDHLAGAIDDDLADALGRAVAAAHAKAPVVEAEPWIAALGAYIDEHAEAFSARGDILSAAAVAALARQGREAYEPIVPLLRQRGRNGFVRRIHGDLHLGNIVLIGRRPVLFDAIEFSDIIASGDVLYDLAFLLMDLVERGFPQAANTVLNRYLTEATRRIDDLDGLAALPFFLSMRAAIRAKVTLARMERAPAKEQPTIADAAAKYFAFAQRALAPAKPTLIAIGGLSGTGKSRLARTLAPQIAPMPGAVIVRSDVERKAQFGVSETERLPADAYKAGVTQQVYAMLCDKARRIVAAGHSAIVDAVFAQPGERAALSAAAQSAGVRLHGLFLTAPLEVRLSRIGGRSRDASDATGEVAQAQEGYDIGQLDWTTIDASGTPADTAAQVRPMLD